MIHVVKTVSAWCVSAREAGATPEELDAANRWTVRSAFVTMTNVNFSEESVAEYTREGLKIKRDLEALVREIGAASPPTSAALIDLYLGNRTDPSLDELEDFGYKVGIQPRQKKMGDDDAFALNELATAGVKGTCAYVSHCYRLGTVPDEEAVMRPIHEIWAKLGSDQPDFDGLLANALRVGEVNSRVLAMLDESHSASFGAPEPTQIRTTAVAGKAILISGHDLKDLEALLQQTEGTGINVYTHGEMLPGNTYPGLKKYSHLAGNFGTAWQNQMIEFATFPGPIVVTTNCVVNPRRTYKGRLFTMNQASVDGVQHVGRDRDFSEVIDVARSMKGFPKTVEPPRFHSAGYNHRSLLADRTVDKLVDAAKSGQLSRILVVGLCDGTEWDRSYYTEVAEESPPDSVVLTMGCAKNRLIRSSKFDGATLQNGVPRLLDMGQCNDVYSAVVLAKKLAEEMGSEEAVPVSFALSHLEQKAAANLLTLLHLGVKNLRFGPRLPAYVTPRVMDVLRTEYGLLPTKEAGEDLKSMLAGK